jgi:antitoxin component YwqK of YwqJK toxin-antitoxin module
MKTIDEDELYCTEDGSYEIEDQPFTGLAREYSKDGKLISETSYVNGLQDGIARYWYSTGELRGEETFKRNGRTGMSRWWYPSGKLQRETTFEHSICVVEKEWNEQGAIVRDFVLKKEDPLFEILEKSRELDKKKR